MNTPANRPTTGRDFRKTSALVGTALAAPAILPGIQQQFIQAMNNNQMGNPRPCIRRNIMAFEIQTRARWRAVLVIWLLLFSTVLEPIFAQTATGPAPDDNIRFGLELGKEGDVLKIRRVTGMVPDRAGLKPGQVIVKIDGKPTPELSMTEATKLIQGPAGTKVVLEVLKSGEAKVWTVELTRSAFEPLPDVESRAVESNAGWLVVRQFSASFTNAQTGVRTRDTSQKIKALLGEFKASHVRGLVLDLRDGNGGNFKTAVTTAGYFLGRGTVVWRQHVGTTVDTVVCDAAREWDGPLVVVVNGYTAAVEELLAYALQAHGRARLIGQKTHGEAVISTLQKQSDGSMKRADIGWFESPTGQRILTEGLQPDVIAGDNIDEQELQRRAVAELR